ncbi:MAG: hypothetical protein LAT67_14815 [Balneolales bacterium]|nr:hypothetical protein [Balneolales bacterium]
MSSKFDKNAFLSFSGPMTLLLFLVFLISSCSSFDPDNPEDVLRKAARNYFNTIYELGYIAPAKYAEQAKVDGVYGALTLKKGYLHSAGYDCMIPVANFSFIASEIAKSNRSEAWLDLLEHSYEILEFDYMSDIQPIINSTFTMFRFFEKNGVMADRKNYELELVQKPEIYNAHNYLKTIRFKDLDIANYEGEIYIGADYNVSRIVFDRVPFYQPVFQRWILVQADVRFTLYNEKLFVSEITVSHNRSGVEFKSSILVQEPLEKSRAVTDNEFRIVERYKGNPLVSYSGGLLEEYSNIFNWLDTTALRNDLEKNSSLEDQFTNNSGKPFLQIISTRRGDLTPIYENEVYPEILSLLGYFQSLSL